MQFETAQTVTRLEIKQINGSVPKPTPVVNKDMFGNQCRTCGQSSDYLLPIFEDEGLQDNLAELINKHLPIMVSPDDNMPHVICDKCATTITAWHQLKQICLYADASLKRHVRSLETPKPVETDKEQQFNINTSEKHDNTKSSRPQFLSCDTETNGDYVDEGGDFDTPFDDEDEPLSVLASKKSSDLYNTFYQALVNFRDHFVAEHQRRSDPTDSEDSELSAETDGSDIDCPTEPRDVNEFDDLTEQNRRKNHLDDETRTELNMARRKIDGKILYSCSICEKNLSSRHTYLFHRRIHTGERPCVCHLCGKQFRAPPGLRRHLAHTHERRRPRACPLCARAFASAQNLKQHLRTHTGERPYACPLCAKRFTQSGSLHVHLRSHGSAAPHGCPDCGKRFKLRSNLARHRLHHTGERPHGCPHCARTFRQRHDLNCHVLTHLDCAPLACPRCGAAFKQRRALRDHTRRHHPAAESEESDNAMSMKRASARHRCPWCGAGFSHLGNYWRHVRALHPHGCPHGAPLGRPHGCPHCHKTFSRKSHLADHIKSHSAAREYVCEVCGKACKYSAALRMHMKTHDVCKFECVECGAAFKRRVELSAHVSVHTGEKAHVCECGKAFRLRAQLNGHRKRCVKKELHDAPDT